MHNILFKAKTLILIPSLFIFTLTLLFNSCALQPTELALEALKNDKTVIVETTSDFIAFRPKVPFAIRTGFIFYPGGLVEEKAYSPLCRAIAEQGFFVVITPVPFKLAVFNPFVALPIMNEMRFIRTWAIGGHSLGGAMAARFVYEDSTRCKGLILLASYPDASNNLANRNISVLSISSSLDGLATPETIARNKQFLPQQTRYVVIEGGNHAQFGNYGKQNRDNDATISATEQQRKTVEEAVRFLKNL